MKHGGERETKRGGKREREREKEMERERERKSWKERVRLMYVIVGDFIQRAFSVLYPTLIIHKLIISNNIHRKKDELSYINDSTSTL